MVRSPRPASTPAGLLSAADAELVVGAAEKMAAGSSQGWLTERHTHYPTTDFSLWSVAGAAELWNASLRERVVRTIGEDFGIEPSLLEPRDVFIVKSVEPPGWTDWD